MIVNWVMSSIGYANLNTTKIIKTKEKLHNLALNFLLIQKWSINFKLRNQYANNLVKTTTKTKILQNGNWKQIYRRNLAISNFKIYLPKSSNDQPSAWNLMKKKTFFSFLWISPKTVTIHKLKTTPNKYTNFKIFVPFDDICFRKN